MRCFIGLAVEPQTRRALSSLFSALKVLGPEAAQKIRPVPPGNLHLTLKFLGESTQKQHEALSRGLSKISTRFEAPRASLAGLSAFPSPQNPRAIFAKVAVGAETIIALGQAVEHAAIRAGFGPETRARVPHVTLARIKNPKRGGPLTQFILKQRETAPWGEIDGRAMILYQSKCLPEGSVYTPLERFSFPSQ